MLRNLAAALALILLSQSALGLGLGTLKQSSALNEPFDGRIEILGATAGDFDTIAVKLADSSQFERAGVLRDAVLLQLKFRIVEGAAGNDFIQISSREPIREPFLNFLLELNWANGRMVREYTVLLDPPLYDPQRRRVTAPRPAPAPAQPMPAPAPTPMVQPPAETMVKTVPMTPAPIAAPTPMPTYGAGSTFGPVQLNDTLWSIASANRPDDSVSVQQMMLALLRANPDAFGSNNINILKRGAILRLPDRSEIDAMSRADAIEEVKRQHQLWSDYRGLATETVAEQPLGAEPGPEMEPVADEDMAPAEPMVDDALAEAAAEAETGDARLELVAPRADDEQMGAGAVAEGEADVTLAREELDAQVQANAELQAGIAEANEIIDLMQRQVDIKDDELAALQTRLAELGIEAPADIVAGVEAEDIIEVPSDAEMMPEEAPDVTVDVGEVDIMIGDEAPVPDIDAMPEDVGEVAETTVADDMTAPMDDGGGVAPEEGALGGLIPGHIVNMVPGGAMTVFGVLGVALLGIIAALFKLIGGRREGEEEELGAIAAAAGEETPTEGVEEEEEPITETREEAGETEEFAPGDTVEGVPEFQATSPEFQKTVESAPDEFQQTVETTPDDFEKTLEATADELMGKEAEEDPLEEVNVYLAYERFDQAEELVRKVIADHPDEHKYKLRLLEVFYSSNNKAAYEEAARPLHDAVEQDNPLWKSAVAMWTEMSPERALFAGGAAEPVEAAADEGAEKAFVDITAEEEAGGRTVSMAPGGDDLLETTQVSLGAGTEEGEDTESLDFDLGAGEGDAGEDEILDLTKAEEETGEAPDEVLDLTKADEGADEVLDLTKAEEGADEVLDLTMAEEGADEVLDLTMAEEGAEGADEVLDLTLADETIEGAGEVLDLTMSDESGEVADAILDLTQEDEAADEILDLTATGDEFADEDILDLTATTDAGGLLDATAKGDQAGTPEEDLLDLTAGLDEAPGEQGDVLDISAEADAGEGDLIDLTTPASDASHDLLDVTKTGDFGGEQTDDILNVTAPGLLDEGATAQEEEAAAVGEDAGGVDFDISDTVAPAFGAEEAGPEDDVFDITAPSGEEGLEEAVGGALDFDIGQLEDTTAELSPDDDTLDIGGGLDFDADDTESFGEGLELELPEEPSASVQDSLETVEMDTIDADDEQLGVDTVPRKETEPAAEDDIDFDLSLQSAELDELSIGGDTVGGPEEEADAESEIEFDLALQDTTEMDSLVIDDTLELPKASTSDESLEDLAKSMEESMAGLELAEDELAETTGELDLSLADTSSGLDIDFSELEGGDTETSLDFNLDDIDLDTVDHADTIAMDLSEESGAPSTHDTTLDTVIMPVDANVERQSDADEVDTKLNLAKAYIELGDNDGARSILDEVARDGSEDQQAEAQRLIDQID